MRQFNATINGQYQSVRYEAKQIFMNSQDEGVIVYIVHVWGRELFTVKLPADLVGRKLERNLEVEISKIISP